MIYLGKNYDVGMAVNIVDLLFDYGYIETLVQQKESAFTHTNMSTVELCLAVQLHKNNIHAMVYSKKFWLFSKANASYENGAIKINTRKRRSFASMCGTVAHEKCHHVNHRIKGTDFYFNHGDNDSVDKEDSVPYYVGKMVKNFINELQYTGCNLPESIFRYLVREHE